MRSFHTLCLVMMFVQFAPGIATAATYVVNPEGTGDFPTIQAALDACQAGDSIELTDGVFTGSGNRDLDFLGKSVVVRAQSGNPAGCTLDCQASETEPHRACHFHSGEGPASRLEGVTLRGGYVGGGAFGAAGGGVLCTDDSSPTIEGCVFSENHAGPSMACGGGLACESSSPAVVNCVFTGNTCGWSGCGGGAYCYNSSIVLNNCTFVSNATIEIYGSGGGMICARSSPVLLNCIFTENSAGEGAGLSVYESSVMINGCVFQRNTSADFGGGVACNTSTADMLNCLLDGNQARLGGGVYSYDSEMTITQCTFHANGASERGSGVYVWFGSVSCGNTIIAFGPQAEAVFCGGGATATLTCCDLFGNQGGDWVGCVAEQYGVRGNISADPLFCDPQIGDFTLHADSPCAPFSPPNPECDLTGAYPVGCGATGAQRCSWGWIKSEFR